MLPVKALRIALGELLAADPDTLGAATANKIALVIAPFTPSENLTLLDLTLATFTGSTPKAGVADEQEAGIDPVTGEQKVTILAPLGGWRWECTGAPAEAETVYGFALVDNAAAALLGTDTLVDPVEIASVGDFVDLGKVEVGFVLQPMS